MGEVGSRWVAEPGHDESRRTGKPGEARSYRSRTVELRASLVWAILLLLPGAIAAPPALAQDEPPKAEAPKRAPASPAESLPRPAPPPTDREKADAAPPEQQKGAPTEPAETQKTAPAAPDDTQQPPAAADAGTDREAMLDAALALSTRYKFVERYAKDEDPKRPQLITQYRVGVVATNKYVRETAQGAPERKESRRTTIYVERVARVTKLGEPMDLIRRYDRVIFKDQAAARVTNPPLLQGLTIWYQHRPPPPRPLVLSLTPDRSLREAEYGMIVYEVSISRLMRFFPPTPARVGQTWPIPRNAVQSVSGKLPNAEDYELTGTLFKVSKANDGKSLVAQIGVAGEFNVDAGPSAFHARIDFDFEPVGEARPAPEAGAAPKVLEAAGRITQALLSHAVAKTPSEAEPRLKETATLELVLERRPLALLPGEKGSPAAPLALPEALPTPTVANSWVTYDDPAGRFHFRHPQELEIYQSKIASPQLVELKDVRPSGGSFLGVILPSPRGDTEGDLRFRDASHFQKAMESQFAPDKSDVTWGSIEWLDDEDWKSSKRKVFRMEAALKRENGNQPVYVDFYLVTEPNALKSFSVEAWTERDGHAAFRSQVEDVIKSFHWASSEKRSQSPSPAPGATTGASDSGGGTAPAGPGVPRLTPAPATGAPPR